MIRLVKILIVDNVTAASTDVGLGTTSGSAITLVRSGIVAGSYKLRTYDGNSNLLTFYDGTDPDVLFYMIAASSNPTDIVNYYKLSTSFTITITFTQNLNTNNYNKLGSAYFKVAGDTVTKYSLTVGTYSGKTVTVTRASGLADYNTYTLYVADMNGNEVSIMSTFNMINGIVSINSTQFVASTAITFAITFNSNLNAAVTLLNIASVSMKNDVTSATASLTLGVSFNKCSKCFKHKCTSRTIFNNSSRWRK